MDEATRQYYRKRGESLVKNLKARHFDAYYCSTKEEALTMALSLIPKGASVGWGGAMSAQQIGLIDSIRTGDYMALDRDRGKDDAERRQIMRECMLCDVFLTGANALSLDGQMVNIDGAGNRVSAIIYGPKSVLVIAGMNKVEDTLEAAVQRARTVAAPKNQQRFLHEGTPCTVTGSCKDCKALDCICNHIVVTRHCRPQGRIQFVLVGEDLGL